jgi:hypothetical protein
MRAHRLCRLGLSVSIVGLVLAVGWTTNAFGKALLHAKVYDDVHAVGAVSEINKNTYRVTREIGGRVFDLGKVIRVSDTRWRVHEGHEAVGYVLKTGDRWLVYAQTSEAGHVQRTSKDRWTVHEPGAVAGSVRGNVAGGPAAGAALVLLLG